MVGWVVLESSPWSYSEYSACVVVLSEMDVLDMLLGSPDPCKSWWEKEQLKLDILVTSGFD